MTRLTAPTEQQIQAALFAWADAKRKDETIMTEQWANIEEAPDRFEVSSTGIVRRKSHTKNYPCGRVTTFKPKTVAQTRDKKGYLSVSFDVDDGTRKSLKVHRLVAAAFIPNPNNKPQINHIDSNKTNNEVSNLEWVDGFENMRHSVMSGTKWTKPVRCVNDGMIHKSMRSAARYYGIGHKEISLCCRGIIKETCGQSFQSIGKKEALRGIYRDPNTDRIVSMG